MINKYKIVILLLLCLTYNAYSQDSLFSLIKKNNEIIIFETDSFNLVVKENNFYSYFNKLKGWKNTRDSILIRINSNEFKRTKNLYKILADELINDYSMYYYFLDNWTTEMFNDSLVTIKNKNTGLVESDYIFKKYKDIGTAGKILYIRKNYILKMREIVF